VKGVDDRRLAGSPDTEPVGGGAIEELGIVNARNETGLFGLELLRRKILSTLQSEREVVQSRALEPFIDGPGATDFLFPLGAEDRDMILRERRRAVRRRQPQVALGRRVADVFDLKERRKGKVGLFTKLGRGDVIFPGTAAAGMGKDQSFESGRE